MRKKIWLICLALFITMIFSSCNATNANSKGKIKLGVTSWKRKHCNCKYVEGTTRTKRLQS